jgi:hypothetical protein
MEGLIRSIRRSNRPKSLNLADDDDDDDVAFDSCRTFHDKNWIILSAYPDGNTLYQ